ncbi:DUF3800 domain-containing protein [Lentzea flava]|uniref:DUF3800 domain-containing protein n=1 Tax=Lentzea flava TaxID=103732 RepID=A0ABQ2V8G8_9PSEU|nr:DUF3800 domain-containing protein [Lentzea flava]GGU74301.1 hypothetical protein GCM10010178_77140 [Lentzea flava]
MHLCYLDESGGSEPPDQSPNATPVMVILGLIIDASLVPALTRDFLALKRRHFPGRFPTGPALNHVLTEIKGSELLQMTRSDSRNKRRQAHIFRLELLDLVTRYDCKVVGRVWVKEKGKSLKVTASYCYAVQDISLHFSQFLLANRSHGLLIADGRTQAQNIQVAHSVFTQKWRTGGDPYPPMLEVPLFAHSDNHVGLQIADLIASTLVFPMAAAGYCTQARTLAHSSPRYKEVTKAHGEALKDLQFRYRDETGRWRGGLVVSDPVGKRPGSALFGD